jgi:hypothetical protein
MNDQEIHRRLRRLIGRRCSHQGQRCTLIDLLQTESAVVLRCEDDPLPPIQGDQFGHASRRAAETQTVAIFSTDGQALSPELLDLLATLEARAA